MSYLRKYIKENFIQSHSNNTACCLSCSTKCFFFFHNFGKTHNLSVCVLKGTDMLLTILPGTVCSVGES